MKFLESITILDSDVLIPIDRIKYILLKVVKNGHEIRITSDDGDWIECFTCEQEAYERYNAIKDIIEAK